MTRISVALCVFCITLRAGAFGILDGDSDQSLLKKGREQVLSEGQRDEGAPPGMLVTSICRPCLTESSFPRSG